MDPPITQGDWEQLLRQTTTANKLWSEYCGWLRALGRDYEASTIEKLQESAPLVRNIRSQKVNTSKIRAVELKKSNGSMRTIFILPEQMKKQNKVVAKELMNRGEELLLDAVHGFRPNRSPLTAAYVHSCYPWTLCADLKDHFDNITREKLLSFLTEKQLDICLYLGATRQGLPTSPAASNIGTIKLDQAIIKRWGKFCVYTRYADDLSFSSLDKSVLQEIRLGLPSLALELGHEVNPAKWRLQSAKFGRRTIVGVSVGDGLLRATRETRRRYRAQAHKHSHRPETAGLKSWIDFCESFEHP